jgi:membrane protease YdiL (CAAX protease family)
MDPSEPFRSNDELGSPNPWDPAKDSEQPISHAPVTAPTLSPNTFLPPRWWTTIAISGIALGTFLLASVIMTLVAVAVVHGDLSTEVLTNPKSLEKVSASRIGLLLLVVLPQLALVTPAIIAAFLSPVGTRRRLSLVRGRWPIWAWFAVAAATPLVGMASGVVVSLFLEESETLKEMTKIFRDHGKSGFLIPLALMIGATPAFCEELLFRGYVQTRLTRSFPPIVGILVASFLFAIFHLDPVHVIAVFPLGFFLGWATWKSGSLFPAMMGHFVNNVISVVAVVLAPEDQTDVLALPTLTFALVIFASGFLGVVGVALAAYLYGSPTPNKTLPNPAQVV